MINFHSSLTVDGQDHLTLCLTVSGHWIPPTLTAAAALKLRPVIDTLTDDSFEPIESSHSIHGIHNNTTVTTSMQV